MNRNGISPRFYPALVVTFAISFLVLVIPNSAHCQSRELFYPSGGSFPTGPTTAVKATELSLNADNPTGNTVARSNTAVTVAATHSNQQYVGVGTGGDNPAVLFGAAAQP